MKAPLEQRLLTAIANGTRNGDQAFLSAELACYYARTGYFEEAERIRTDLRKEYNDGRDLRVTVLLMTAEALLLYFRELSPIARTRLAGAQVLSVAGNDGRLIALTSAWMAHIDFNLNRFEDMVRSIDLCLDHINSDDGNAKCRISLVLGDIFMFCRQPERARQWYEKARLEATTIGDHAAVGAITYNRAALRVAEARLRSAESTLELSVTLTAVAELKSAQNYQALAGLRSLAHLLDSARVGSLILQGDFGEALSTIRSILKLGTASKTTGEHTLLLADKICCLALTGEKAEAAAGLLGAQGLNIAGLGPDDRAIAFHALEISSRTLDEKEFAEEFMQQKESSLKEHQVVTNRLIEVVDKYRKI